MAVESITHTTAGKASLSIADLDKEKVYKVVASQARGYLYEIAFQTPLPKKYQLGDVNHDGEVTIADALAIVRHILGEPAEGVFDEKTANVNFDDGITIADAAAVISIILQ
ncbi:MAG: dockerin type I repeat-containing protein [Prevotella sp.]|nr:dockerin type I repeat-containing protein [Prevotella sp.]